MRMKLFSNVLLLLAIPSFGVFGISEAIVERINLNVEQLEVDDSAEEPAEMILADFQKIISEDGILGIARLAFQNTVLLDTFIEEGSIGFENISVSMLKQANSETQMKEMLVTLVAAQVAAGIEVFTDWNIEVFEDGCESSSLNLNPERIEQLISEAMVVGLELGESEVRAATYSRYRVLRESLNKIVYKCFIKRWDNCYSCHKRTSYTSNQYYNKRH